MTRLPPSNVTQTFRTAEIELLFEVAMGQYRRVNARTEARNQETIARFRASSSDAAGVREQCNSTLREFGPWRNDFVVHRTSSGRRG